MRSLPVVRYAGQVERCFDAYLPAATLGARMGRMSRIREQLISLTDSVGCATLQCDLILTIGHVTRDI